MPLLEPLIFFARDIRYLLKQSVCLFVFSQLICGCTKIPPERDSVVSVAIENRIGSCALWRHGCALDKAAKEFIANATAQELTCDRAVQIALLNNPEVQAAFEELNLSHADLWEAGLLPNPSLSLEVRYPPVHFLHTNIEYLLAASLLDIFMVPLRTKVAKIEYAQAQRKAARKILDIAYSVRESFYELVGEIANEKWLKSAIQLSEIISEIANRQLQAGNINALVYEQAQTYQRTKIIELAKAQVNIVKLKEQHNQLLGFTYDVCLTFPSDLPKIDHLNVDLKALEAIALDNRLDLQIAHIEIMRLYQMLGLKASWSYTAMEGGLAGEREPDGFNLIGPALLAKIPIFNWGQAARQRLWSELRQAKNDLAAIKIKALSEVRTAYQLTMAYAEIANDYKAHLLPLYEKICTSSLSQYNVMGLSIDALLECKRNEIAAQREFTESVKEYMRHRVSLDRALGGYLNNIQSLQPCAF